jgi:RND superfamily putative drug exporter
MLAGVDLLSEMGFAVASGIVIVAILMAGVFIPSLATLIGDRLWWPGHRPGEAAEHAPPRRTPRPVPEVAPAPER